jgi:hypothetical protein
MDALTDTDNEDVIEEIDDPELEAIATGRSKGDLIALDADGKRIPVRRQSSSKKIRERTDPPPSD